MPIRRSPKEVPGDDKQPQSIRFNRRGRTSVSVIVASGVPLYAQGPLQERLRQRLGNQQQNDSAEKIQLGDLNVAIWKPAGEYDPWPLVVFSHGFKGNNTQSDFLMRALSDAGYLVVAPNHRDAFSGGNLFSKPQESFKDGSKWTESDIQGSM